MSACGKDEDGRAESPVSNCLSLKSDQSRDVPLAFNDEPGLLDMKPKTSVCGKDEDGRAESPVSNCLSLKSDQSKDAPLAFNDEPGLLDMKLKTSVCGKDEEGRAESPLSSCLSLKSDQSREIPLAFSNDPGLLDTKERKRTLSFTKEQLSCCALCQEVLRDPWSTSCGHHFCMRCIASYLEECDFSCPRCGKRSRKSELQISSQTSIEQITGSLQKVLDNHKMCLGRRCEFAIEGITEAGPQTHLNRIYTELYITEGQCEGINIQHEVWQLETILKMETLHDTPIKCHEIFKALSGQKRFIRVVLTNGVAGIGKTFSVQKFSLDWAEGLENQDINLVILLSFRELNLIKEEQYSLLRLLQDFYPTLHMVTAEKLDYCKVLFILDGLDESRLLLDFQNNEVLSDVTQTSSVNILLINLIKGNLLPSALIWITSRPAAANQIPPSYVDRITEVRGFTDTQKKEYFRRRFSDESMSGRIISHIKASRSLYIMCHIPVFCWITASVLEHMFTTDNRELPKTLTEMYSFFLLVQSKRKTQKYNNMQEMTQQEVIQNDREVLLKLGRLAFEHLEKGNIMFYQEDLEQCGLDVREALVFSGLCTEIFKRECVLFQKMIYCFVHLSIQEFLAAVYMVHCYLNNNIEALAAFLGEDWVSNSSASGLDNFLSRVVDKSLNSGNGHLDLFVRFLHGLLLESNHHLLGDLLGWTAVSPESIQGAINNLKKMNAYDVSPDRSINIFHCLMEMNDQSVHQEIQEYLQADNRSEKKLTKTHCSALAYMLQMSEEVLEVLDLKKYNASGDGRRRLLPAVRNCRRAQLSACGLSEWHCEVLSSALMSNPSHLHELDLSDNDYLLDLGVKLLSVGLESPNCRLEILRLKNCSLSENCCDSLASALKSTSSHLRELDLSNNNYLKDSGVKLLSTGLESPHCRLETLRFNNILLTLYFCMIAVVSISPFPTISRFLCVTDKLQLGIMACNKYVTNISFKQASSGQVFFSSFTCKPLGVVFRVEHASLYLKRLQLKLDNQTFSHSEMNFNPEMLPSIAVFFILFPSRLSCCRLSESGCAHLASAMKANPSHMRVLDLSKNKLKDLGVNLLSVALESPHCQLTTLRIDKCGLTENCCTSLASALKSNPSSLRDLELSNNDLQDSGVNLLCAGLESPHCKLEALRLRGCWLSESCCTSLAMGLMSSSSSLRELDLSENDLHDSGVKLLSAGLESPHCRLEVLRLRRSRVTDEGCAFLVLALKSNSSYLQELDLSKNTLQESGVKLLSDLLQSPHYRLETLRMEME